MEPTYYRTRYSFDPGRKAVWRAIVEHLQRMFFPGREIAVVDLGCGYGDFVNLVKAHQRFAVDVEDVSSYLESDIHFLHQDLTNLSPIGDSAVEVVFSSNVFEHLTKPQLNIVMSEVRRILKPGGLLILIQPNFRFCYRNYFDDYTHETVFSDISLSDFIKSQGLEIRSVKPRFLPFSMKSLIPKSYFLTKIYLSLGFPFIGKQMLVVAQKGE